MRRILLSVSLVLLAAIAAPLRSQDRGAARLRQLVAGLTVTPRVLIVGVHPDDDDPQLMTWLARARSVETGYLSLTRGEAGQNFTGGETGAVLGAIRTQELLAARRIDGGQLYFTSAFDFGMSKSADDAIKHWIREDLVGDIVTVLRSFRPHVVIAVFPDSVRDGNGQHQALGILVRQAYDAAADTMRFPAARFGHPWEPLKLYRHGKGVTVDLGEFDPVSGRTYADIAIESRAQHRSEGLLGTALRRISIVQIRRAASRVNDSTPPADERSLFDGIDTSMARLAAGTSADVARALSAVVAYADSARAALDLRRPAGVVPYLAHAAQLVAVARRGASWCGHPTPEAVIPTSATGACDGHAMDLDASVDVMLRRVTEALLLAAGVTFEVAADRELVADTDTVPVFVTMYNHGSVPVTLRDVAAAGAYAATMNPVVVLPDSVARVFRMVTGLVNSHPWWIGRRDQNMFAHGFGSIDGVERGPGLPLEFLRPGVSIPEAMRRESDVTISVTVDSATVTMSLGPAIYRYSDASVGMQHRAVSGAPAVTLNFEQNLEWIVAKKPLTRPLRLSITSFSDRQQTLKLNFVTPKGVRLDSLPESFTLEPREQRELFLPLRGMLDTGRFTFAAIANSKTGGRFTAGFQTVQYPHLPPIRVYRSSGVYLQSVDVVTPRTLAVVYVQGAPDGLGPALQQIGVSTAVVTPDQLAAIDLSRVTTVVIGPRVYDAYPQLLSQTARLHEFARKGGSVVVLQHTWIPTNVLPYSLVVGRPIAEHVTAPDAPVATLDPESRLLTWPNAIRADDWSSWAGARALYVPTVADPHYMTLIETHDSDEKANKNAILVAAVGKGAYIYTALTLPEQITAGVPGALRLFVNMVSYSLVGARNVR